MLTFSPVWHGRLRAVRGLTNLLMQTLVIHPALLFFLLFLLSAHHAGGAGQMLLGEAERLVRNAPPGKVWGCAQPSIPMKDFTPGLGGGPSFSSNLKSAPSDKPCEKAAISRDVWAEQTSGTLLTLYIAGVVLSFISGQAVWHLRRRIKGETV